MSRHTCGGWWAPWLSGSAIGLYYYLRVAVSLYAPEQPGRDAPSNWQYSAGGIVVLISALLVLVLGVWPQPLRTHCAVSNAADVSYQFVSQKAADMLAVFLVLTPSHPTITVAPL